MGSVRTAPLAGIVAVAVAGPSGVAAARDLTPHVMTVQLPGGSVAEIRYTGEIPPQVVFSPLPKTLTEFAPRSAFFGPASPFATLDQISAAMDREAASLMRQAEMLANAPTFAPNGPIEVALGNLPPGIKSYSMVSTWSGNGACTQSIEITSTANGAKPRVVSHSSGNCGTASGSTGAVRTPAMPAPTHRPEIIETNAHGTPDYPGLVREAAWQH